MVNIYRIIIVIVEEPWQQIVDRRELPPVLRRAPSSHWRRFCALPGQVDDARPSVVSRGLGFPISQVVSSWGLRAVMHSIHLPS